MSLASERTAARRARKGENPPPQAPPRDEFENADTPLAETNDMDAEEISEPQEPDTEVAAYQDEEAAPEVAVAVPAPAPKTAAPAPKPKPPTQGQGAPRQHAPRAAASKDLHEMDLAEEKNLRVWLETVAGGADIRISVVRVQPMSFQGKKVSGTVASYSTIIDEEFLAQNHGGGTYTLRVNKKSADGHYHYWKAKTVEIAGDPRIDDVYRSPDPNAPSKANGNGAESGIVSKAFDILAQQAQAQRAPQGTGNAELMAMIEVFTKPLYETISRLERQAENAVRKPEPTLEEKSQSRWVDKLIEGDSARIATLRAAHDAEVAQLRQSAIDDKKRYEDRFDRAEAATTARHEREISALKASFEREIAALRASNELMTTTIKSSADTSSKILEGQNKQLERELTAAQTELATLRAKKDQGIFEKVEEVGKIKKILGVGDDDKGEKSRLEQVLDSKVAERVVDGIISKVGAMVGDEEKPKAQERPMPELNRPFRGKDGQVYVNTAEHGIVLMQQPRARRRRPQPQQGAPASEQPTQPGAETQAEADAMMEPEVEAAPDIQLDPEQVKEAITFMEAAYQSNTAPATFAATARSLVPSSLLSVIRKHGVDVFLDRVAGLESNSPLAQQGGRNWIRKVAKALLGEG